ncbi:hypothetical protein PL11_002135 [Lentilactobacillus curieae]|uniref:TraX protein n=2 Tax=Lentilactobacillus curieae TaxID=1138822 RepID=A0A1S6QGR2_9LACO|nr:hypothetical protein PL11_002135 [Lentilactobacillus curieae]
MMFIDHVHEMFEPVVPGWVDWIGRPVAVIFMFISVEGFIHTHDRLRYMMRLLIGFWIMNIGTAIVQHFFSIGDFALLNNIFGTLFLGVFTMYGISFIEDGIKQHSGVQIAKGIGIILIPIVWSVVQMSLFAALPKLVSVLFIFPSVTMAEGGVLLYVAPLLYLLRKKRSWQMIGISAVAVAIFLMDPSHAFTTNTEWMLVFSIVILSMYNGQKGKSMRNFFYVFYPVHIWLFLISVALLFSCFYIRLEVRRIRIRCQPSLTVETINCLHVFFA